MYVRQRAVLVLAGLSGLFFFSTASNSECEPQASFDLPITMSDGVPLARLSVQKKEVVFIMDTGAERTLLSIAAAERLQLPRNMAYPRHVRGLNGGVAGGAVELPGLSAGATHLKSYGALVASIDLPKIGSLLPDGLLGADILSDFDVDIDLSHGRVRLACATGQPVWTQAHTAIAANRSIHDRLFFRADLDDPAKIDARTEEYREKFADPFVAASRGFIDDVIQPATTRRRLCRALHMLRDKQLANPWKKHDNIPL